MVNNTNLVLKPEVPYCMKTFVFLGYFSIVVCILVEENVRIN